MKLEVGPEPMPHKVKAGKGPGYESSAHHGETLQGWPHHSDEAMSSYSSTYETEAHTKAHHGPDGRAHGEVGDMPEGMGKVPTQEETGRRRLGDGGPSHIASAHDTANKAHHHPRAGEPHAFDRTVPSGQASGYGHSSGNRHGHLRHSGHSGAHRIGHKSK